jgi:hypothetical protein
MYVRMTFAISLTLSAAISFAHSETNVEANRIFADNMVRAAVDLAKLPNVGLLGCGSSTEYLVGYARKSFNEELVHASRGGATKIIIKGFAGERTDADNPRLDYWLTKIRMSGGNVELKDVTPNETVVTAVLAWIAREYAKDLVTFVASTISDGARAIYGIAADEYMSAGIGRYNAEIAYVRDSDGSTGRGIIQQVTLTCTRQ